MVFGDIGDCISDRHFAEVKTPGAYLSVAIVSANLYLFAFQHALTKIIQTDVHGGFSSATANGLDFLYIVRQTEQPGSSIEGFAGEVGSQAKTDDRCVVYVGDFVQLPHLVWLQELGLINEHTRQVILAFEQLREMRGLIEHKCAALQSQT